MFVGELKPRLWNNIADNESPNRGLIRETARGNSKRNSTVLVHTNHNGERIEGTQVASWTTYRPAGNKVVASDCGTVRRNDGSLWVYKQVSTFDPKTAQITYQKPALKPISPQLFNKLLQSSRP